MGCAFAKTRPRANEAVYLAWWARHQGRELKVLYPTRVPRSRAFSNNVVGQSRSDPTAAVNRCQNQPLTLGLNSFNSTPPPPSQPPLPHPSPTSQRYHRRPSPPSTCLCFHHTTTVAANRVFVARLTSSLVPLSHDSWASDRISTLRIAITHLLHHPIRELTTGAAPASLRKPSAISCQHLATISPSR
jgi:hypothetical protein